MVARGSLVKFLRDVWYLWLEQMLEVQSYWLVYVGFSLFFPLVMVFGLPRIGGELRSNAGLIYVITGTSVFAVANEGLATMAIRVAMMRREGVLVYYASLPVSKGAFVVALVASRFLIALPGMVVPLVIGPLLYKLSVTLDVRLMIVLALTSLAVAAFGTACGMTLGSVEVTQLIVNVLLFVVVMVAPVFMPWDSVPGIIRSLAFVLPFSYAADGLRESVFGMRGIGLWADMVVLLAMTVVSLSVLEQKLRWRLD